VKTSWFTENLSYKFVALGVAVILWMSMLGRKDSTLVRDFELQIMVSANMEILNAVEKSVKVEILGPRVALKKINQTNPTFTIDLTGFRPGNHVVPLRREGLNLPIGARVINIEPREISINLREVSANPPGENK
jgi:YbbR domain-containing protein